MDKYLQKLDFSSDTNQKMLRLIGLIDRYQGEWKSSEFRENRYLKELRQIASTQSIGSSTRIEGATMTDEEIHELLKNIKITRMKTRSEQEVMGYYEVLDLIYENYHTIKLTENYIKQLHHILLKHSEKDTRHRGGYKNLSNQVIAAYPSGEQRVIFATTEPALVESEMFELVAWTNRQFEEDALHPLIIIALFIYEFLSIHPFQDGNGRLSRLLTTLCLLQRGYGFVQYISFEKHIEEHKKNYYEVLMDGQRKRYSRDERISAWALFFLEGLHSLTKKLDQTYKSYKDGGAYLNERQKRVREYIADHQPVKLRDLRTNLPDIPLGTLKKDLGYLRDEQAITMVGRGKGSVYLILKE
jgi:Fic family protein